MAMTHSTSTCLSLLVLLSSFPVSLGDASVISGSSLIGVSSVSEILDQFFKKQEMNGRKVPGWKSEAQAMISLVQSLNDINATTQATVDGYVRNIIDTLKADLANLPTEQANAKTSLDNLKTMLTTELGHLSDQLTKVKTLSGSSKDCRSTVVTLNTSYLGEHGCTNSYLPSQGGTCPTECGKPSTKEFELTSKAKETYTCDFEAGETAKACVARLWAEVNVTRTNLTNKYNAWATKKAQCEAEMAKCAKCNPLFAALNAKVTECDGKRDVLYGAYCTLQTDQTDFCSSNGTLYSQWSTVESPAQDARASEFTDLDFIICIFEKYLETKTFSNAMISSCTKKTAADFYGTTSTGELTLPAVDSSDVPACYGAVSHSSGSPLFDMTGLINELKYDDYATTVSVADHLYAPAAGSTSKFCTLR